MQLYVVRRPSAWAAMPDIEQVSRVCDRIADDEMQGRVRWIRSYAVHEPDGRLGTFCVYEAADGEAIREHARRAGIPGEEFYPVAETLVVRPDPGRQAGPRHSS
ncbi:MAG: hypothetical protein ABS35_44530 [Kaistia sp. SCN 65-12]|jgi:hypothetical protein|nr:MAG: hypothetical protein ABS35_44530 [Kaistia sp. SCN 65-12]